MVPLEALSGLRPAPGHPWKTKTFPRLTPAGQGTPPHHAAGPIWPIM
jgi:hypothetical protein